MEPRSPSNPQHPTEHGAPIAASIRVSDCVLQRISVRIPDAQHDSLEDKGRALAELLRAYGFTFSSPTKRVEIATTLVTALISETRLSEKELFDVQDALCPTTWEQNLANEGTEEPLYGISISCVGGVEVSVDPLDPSSSRLTQTDQRIQLRHVEVYESAENETPWVRDADAWKDGDSSDDIYDSLSDIIEIESPTMRLEYNCDPANSGIQCSIIFDCERTSESPSIDWGECNEFLLGANLPAIPESFDLSWRVERDPVSPSLKASKGVYTIEFEFAEPQRKHHTEPSVLTKLVLPAVEWQDLRLAKCGEVHLTKPTPQAIKAICQHIGVPEVAELILKGNVLSKSGDNPTHAIAPLLDSLGGGELTVWDHHLLDSCQLESKTSTYITLENTRVGAIHIEILFGKFFNLTVFPPTPSPADDPQLRAFQREQIINAAKIPWGDIAARAREFNDD